MTHFNSDAETRFLHAGIEQLKDYLLSSDLFWNAGQSQQLTLGNLLLAQTYLEGVGQLSSADAQQLAALKKEWGSAWEQKGQKEFGARLRQWTAYLNELRQYPDQHAAYYATEVRVRTLLELLKEEVSDVGDALEAPDQVLRVLLTGEEFVWDHQAQAAFPRERFWFLYGQPHS